MTRRAAWVVPLGLYVVALLARLVAAAGVDFPPTEVSAYYVGVARNIAEGRGMVSDAVWSYATPPLVTPKPAFDLWLPMGTLVALPAMLVLGPTLAAAQFAHALLGAALAPMAWWLGADAAARAAVPAGRARWIALGSGAIAAALGPLLVAVVGPDSTTPFAVFAVAAALVAPRALGEAGAVPRARSAILLGVLLGLAYLSRQEAVFLGTGVLLIALARPDRRLVALLPVAAGGAIVTLPWLARNAATFGTVFPGQAIENALLVRTSDIFAWADRPSLGRFLAQSPATLVENVAAALRHNIVDVLILSAMPIGVVGLVTAAAMLRSGALRGASPLRVLVLSGLLTFVAITLVFPVATLSGTWLHASGPTLVALGVLASLGVDAIVARVGRLRGWDRGNAWLAPLALLALAIPMSALQIGLVSAHAREEGARAASIAAWLDAEAPADLEGPALSDHPIWLAEATGRTMLALPDEPPENLRALAAHFGADHVVVLDGRGSYPGVLAEAPCFEPVAAAGVPAHVFRVQEAGCEP